MATPQSRDGGAGVNPGGPANPEQAIDSAHDGAPAGPFFSDAELPTVSVPGGTPMTLGGYSPDNGQPPLVSNLQDPTGTGNLPPAGIRK